MENNTEIMEEKEYTLRALETDDIFPMMNIITKIGIKRFKACFENEEVSGAISSALAARKAGDDNAEAAATAKAAVERVGMFVMIDVADILLSSLPLCKDDLYLLLSQLSGKTTEEIGKQPPRTTIRMIKDVLQKDNFADFFGDVLSLVPKGK